MVQLASRYKMDFAFVDKIGRTHSLQAVNSSEQKRELTEGSLAALEFLVI